MIERNNNTEIAAHRLISRGSRMLGCASLDFRDGRNRSGVYAIICRGNMYIGSAKYLSERWSAHKSSLRDNKHHSQRLQNSWNKYGPDAFAFVIISYCEVAELRTLEQRYIDMMNPVFNMRRDANRPPESWKSTKPNHFKGKKHTEETLQKLRGPNPNVAGENNPMYGVRRFGERNHMWGRKRPDTAEFNRRTKKGKTLEEMHGPEKAAKLRELMARRGEANGNFGTGRAVVQLSLDENIIAVFPNACRAAAILGIKHVGIYHCLYGHAKTAYEYKWRYADELNA